MSDPQLSLDFGGYRVHERRSDKARRIRVEIRSPREVLLVIPRRAARADALAFLASQESWLRRKLGEMAARRPHAPAALRWDGSDLIPLRGVDTPLRVLPASGRSGTVRIGAAIEIHAPAALRAKPERLARLLERALLAECRRDAEPLLNAESARLGLPWRRLALRDPRTRWGSCGPDGDIMLSWRLVLAPPDVLRYVVVHELCHLRWRGHGPRFWALVEKQMPEFETARRWLRENGASLHTHIGI